MQPPPLDKVGVIPHDHPEISANDTLVRYLRNGVHIHFVDGVWRVSSAAFSPSSPASAPRSSVSVDHERSMIADGMPMPYRLSDSNQGVAGIVASVARDLSLKVGWDPQPGNKYHCGIWGIGNNKSKRVHLARTAVILYEPKT